METLWQDLRYAVRNLGARPGFALLCTITLALGIGSTTAMFSIIQNVLLDPFPYVDARSVVMPQVRDARQPEQSGRAWFKPREFLELQAQTSLFREVIGSTADTLLYTTPAGTERLIGTFCTGNTFDFLGVPALLGRTLDARDCAPDAPPVFVARYRFWRDRLNADPAALGRVFVFNGVARTLVGVMPPRFTKGDGDFYLPVAIDATDPSIRERLFRFQARLQPGVTPAQAEAALDVLLHHRARENPGDYPTDFVVRVVSWVDNVVKDFRATLYLLAGAVLLLLLVACANTANLLLTRASTREREMAVRAALGASRARLIRQLLVESLVLALAGLLLGTALAHLGVEAISHLIPARTIPDEADLRLNGYALAFALVVALGTSLACGLAPALAAGRLTLTNSLQEAGHGSTAGRQRHALRRALVVGAIALSIVLLSGAGLLLRSFTLLQSQPLGLDAERLAYMPLTLPEANFPTPADKAKFFRTVLPRLLALPGVEAVSAGTTPVPLRALDSPLEIRGQVGPEKLRSRFELCSEGYLATLGLRVVRGRWLTAEEFDQARRVAVINESFARRYFAGGDPIGRQISLARVPPAKDAENPWFEIVGVISDNKNSGPSEPVAPQVFLPHSVSNLWMRAVLMRTANDPRAQLRPVQQTIWSVDRSVAMDEGATVDALLRSNAFAGPRFNFAVLGVFATVGLALVLLGLYSAMSYTVACRRREMGIRLALGATPGKVLRLILGEALGLLLAGLALGLAGSLLTVRLVAHLLWGVTPYDAPTLAAVSAVILGAGLLAAFFPARRATRVDPLVALRDE